MSALSALRLLIISGLLLAVYLGNSRGVSASPLLDESENEIGEDSGSGFGPEESTTAVDREEPATSAPHPSEGRLSCPKSQTELESRITYIINKNFPRRIDLPEYSRGRDTRLTLTNGQLDVQRVRLLNDPAPLCMERDDGSVRYDFYAQMEDLSGSYDWRVENFFRRNFSENVVTTARDVRSQFLFGGEADDSGREQYRLEDVRVTRVEDLNVKVNMPRELTNVNSINRFLSWLASRVSTFVANRSKSAIAATIENAIRDSIRVFMDSRRKP